MFSTTIALFLSKFGAVTTPGCDTSKTFFGLPVWYKYINTSAGPGGGCDFTHFTFFDPKTGHFTLDNLFLIALAVLDALLVLAGILAVVFVIYGAVQYILSQGEPERTKSAQSTIINALIGLVIALFAAVLVNYIGIALSH